MEKPNPSPESQEESKRKRLISRRRYEAKRRRETKQLVMRFADRQTVKAARDLIKAVMAHSKVMKKSLFEAFEKYAELVDKQAKKDLHGKQQNDKE